MFNKIKTVNKISITKEERKEIIKQIAIRIKNIVFMQAEKRVIEIFNNLHIINWTEDNLVLDIGDIDEININYQINIIGEDLVEILGGLRRNRVKELEITDTERLDFELSHTTEWQGFTGGKDYWELEVWIGIGDKRHSETFEAQTKRECLDKAIPYIKKLEEREDNKI